MKRFLLVAAMVAASIPATPAMALRSHLNAQQLLNMCDSPETVDTLMCLIYIEGVVDAWEMDRLARSYRQCIDDQVAPKRIVASFEQFMRDHPTQGGIPAAIQVTRAAREDFCKS